jgi:hypothetical protein
VARTSESKGESPSLHSITPVDKISRGEEMNREKRKKEKITNEKN